MGLSGETFGRGTVVKAGVATAVGVIVGGVTSSQKSSAQAAAVDLGGVSQAIEDYQNLLRGNENTVTDATRSFYDNLVSVGDDADTKMDEAAGLPGEGALEAYRQIQHMFRHADHSIDSGLFHEEHDPNSIWHDFRTSALNVHHELDHVLDFLLRTGIDE